jgi:aromatic ring-cleaving dioxygenase
MAHQPCRSAAAHEEKPMTAFADPSSIQSYHAHIYYDAQSRSAAAAVREQIQGAFTVEMGRWRDEPVGPHPQAMYQIAFGADQFPRLVPWLMLNREGLTVLVHPNTGDAYRDHAEHALWLGAKLALRLDILKAALAKG